MSNEVNQGSDILRKLSYFGAWVADYYQTNKMAPDEGAIKYTLIRCHLADLNPDNPDITFKPEANAVIPAYSNPDNCHP